MVYVPMQVTVKKGFVRDYLYMRQIRGRRTGITYPSTVFRHISQN
jgi:hypothetical protein